MPHPIKVLLVEDSPVALAILKKLLSSSPEVTVAGTASNGKEALEAIAKLQPQVICTDLHMKEMDGLELTKQVMSKYPRPILVISASVQKENTQRIFELLQAGALDIFPKPVTGLPSDYERVKQELITKIKILSGVKVFTKLPPSPLVTTEQLRSELPPPIAEPLFGEITNIKMVAIGASTGGPQALYKILCQLPSNFPAPIICTQHISVGFLQGLVDWLGSECKLKIKIAQIGELPSAGTIYFAPEERHLELSPQGRFISSTSDRVDGHCPSVTVMFKSAIKAYGRATAGILLTGMGRDGAAGMQAIAQAGGITIAQDEKSCVVFGMPKEAIALGAAQHVLPIQEIAPLLLKKV
ncbi:MAG: chemotaxis-specific protein-glutamate methyltransferase CheB [Cyanosarcina radialis HA8281-LM2]|jgi:two-component system chemotaxis response regulator CheB|nr:chemotaxis-specific protein-glutamate methyltransferase CheB [Cyanosarcina radialis HA8281-LM2]